MPTTNAEHDLLTQVAVVTGTWRAMKAYGVPLPDELRPLIIELDELVNRMAVYTQRT